MEVLKQNCVFLLKISVLVMYFSAHSLQTLANSRELAKERNLFCQEFNSGLCIFIVKVCNGLKFIRNDCHFIPSGKSITA